jgi:phosphoribosyl 1,2-cyclic phosphodiesterase
MINQFTIHGTRGTMPVAGRQFAGHGAQTTCFSLRTPQGLLVVDAGTGIISLSDHLKQEKALPPITLLFTHFHLDHVIGLPLFNPIYRPDARITIMADPQRTGKWQRSLETIVAPPYWPVPLADYPARIRLRNLPSGRAAMIRHGIHIAWCPVWHPQQCLAYRLTTAGRSIVIATDHEAGNPRLDERFLRFCRDADVLIYDAQYTPRELAAHRGWGHGAWREAVAIAREAQAGELILTHHDRYHTDAQLDAMVRQARRIFPRTRAAREGMTL